MKFKEYISFVYKGQSADSPFQYETSHSEAFYQENHSVLEEELQQHFILWVYGKEVKKSQLFGFLDYHMKKYSGDKIDFWEFINTSPGRPFDPDEDKSSAIIIREYQRTVLNYVEPKQEWLNLKKEYAYSEYTNFGGLDDRIEGNLSKPEIEAYFIEHFFHTKDKKGTPYFSEEEIEHFLHANFKDFEPKREVLKLKSKARMAQAYIKRTVYKFYCRHTTENSKEKRRYCELLRDNFHEFDKSDFENSIMANFSK
jgi:hypothetical protein